MQENTNEATLIRRLLAWFLIVIGLSGIILPFLPGWPLIFWGLFIIGGSAMVDRSILKYFPKKTRKKILHWLEQKESKQ